MTFRVATVGDEAAWQAFLGAQESGDFLHDWAWSAVAAFDGQPQRRFVVEEAGRPVVLAAAQVRQMRFGRSFWYVPHGPVADFGHPAAADRLRVVVAGLLAAARADRAVVVRLEPRIEDRAAATGLLDAIARRTAERLQVGQTRIVDLGDDEAILAGYDSDTRNAVRRADREGVVVQAITDPDDGAAVDRLYRLVQETQRRAGFRLPPFERYWLAWRGLAGAGRACLFEARREDEVLASAMLVIEGQQSFYLFAGSRREARGEPKRFASYAVQWAMMREARQRGARRHDLWGVAPPGAGPDHPWHGVGLFKRGFGGREVRWAGSWEIVVDPRMQLLREVVGRFRRPRRR